MNRFVWGCLAAAGCFAVLFFLAGRYDLFSTSWGKVYAFCISIPLAICAAAAYVEQTQGHPVGAELYRMSKRAYVAFLNRTFDLGAICIFPGFFMMLGAATLAEHGPPYFLAITGGSLVGAGILFWIIFFVYGGIQKHRRKREIAQ